MEIIYLHHSGFAILANQFTIIIDFFEDSESESCGILHDKLLNKDGPMYVLSSHFHADHFGDAESQVESTLTTIGDVDLFKAGHHGSSTSNTASLLNRITPEHVVIMAGANNQYGHPDAEVMDRFKNLGIPVYRTDEQGTIIVTLSEDGVSVNKQPGSYQAGKQPESSSSTSNSSSGSSSSNTSPNTSST